MTITNTTTIPVYVVLVQPSLLLDMAGPLEVLRVANREIGQRRFDVRYVGPTTSVMTSIGIVLTGIDPLPEMLPDHSMVMLIGDVDYVMTLDGWPAPKKDGAGATEVVEWLRKVVRPGHKVVCICSGSLLAGRAGLLDERLCTTH